MKAKIISVAVVIIAAVVSFAASRLLYSPTSNPDWPPCAGRRAARLPEVASGLRVDLSDTYGRVNLTIFNKRTRVAFSTPSEFFLDAGVRSFDGLVFDELARLPPGLRLVNGRRLTEMEVSIIESSRQ